MKFKKNTKNKFNVDYNCYCIKKLTNKSFKTKQELK